MEKLDMPITRKDELLYAICRVRRYGDDDSVSGGKLERVLKWIKAKFGIAGVEMKILDEAVQWVDCAVYIRCDETRDSVYLFLQCLSKLEQKLFHENGIVLMGELYCGVFDSMEYMLKNFAIIETKNQQEDAGPLPRIILGKKFIEDIRLSQPHFLSFAQLRHCIDLDSDGYWYVKYFFPLKKFFSPKSNDIANRLCNPDYNENKVVKCPLSSRDAMWMWDKMCRTQNPFKYLDTELDDKEPSIPNTEIVGLIGMGICAFNRSACYMRYLCGAIPNAEKTIDENGCLSEDGKRIVCLHLGQKDVIEKYDILCEKRNKIVHCFSFDKKDKDGKITFHKDRKKNSVTEINECFLEEFMRANEEFYNLVTYCLGGLGAEVLDIFLPNDDIMNLVGVCVCVFNRVHIRMIELYNELFLV